MTRADMDIQNDVIEEIAFDPSVKIADINVAVKHGEVTLTGTADMYATKFEAEKAAFRVYGVKDVTNNISVDPEALGIRTDAAIAKDIHSMLLLDTDVPDSNITVNVSNGDVTLSGKVDWFYQRNSAEADARSITGVRSLVNNIVVQSPPSAFDISSQITRAFARNGELYDDNVTVDVDGHAVTLGGEVRTWSEFDEAENVAWRAPGVTSVTNNIVVTY